MSSARESVPGATAATAPQDGAVAGRRSRRRRQELVDAAAKIFQEKGYEAASIQDIAEALGILKGSIYYYIDSKEDLLYAVLQEVHETALGNMEQLRLVDADALAKIRMFIGSHVRHFTDNLVKVTVFFHDFRSLAGERRDYIVAERALYTNYLRELIVQGQKEGVVCVDVDPKLASFAILGMINWSYQWYRADGDLDAADIAGQFSDLVLSGLACTPQTHRANHRSKLGVTPAGVTIGEQGTPVSLEPPRKRARRATAAAGAGPRDRADMTGPT